MTIFLDADDQHWMIANSRRELYNALIAKLDPESISDLTDLAAVVFGCEVDSVAIIED